jgi:dipeptidyl aminopeptidase/acylaminoacyl peptidase
MRTAAPAAAKVTPELVMQLRRPTDLAVSHDGARLAYIVAPTFREKGKALESRLWIDGAEATEAGAADASPRFAPDGTLAYASDRGHAGRMSLWIDGRGEVGDIAGSVEDIQWSPDSGSVLVLAADLGSDRAGAETATKIKEAGAEEADPKISRPAAYWRRLYAVDIESGAAREVGPEGVNVFEFGWAGGGKAAAVCTDEPSESAWYGAWIGLIDLDARSVERVHTADWQLQCPCISPGGRVAWIEGFASDRAVVTGTAHVLGIGPLAPELDLTWLAFLDEDTLWYAGSERSGTIAGKLGVDGVVDGLFSFDAVVGLRFQPKLSPSADGSRVAAIFEGPVDPPEVVFLEDGAPRPVTALNADVAPQLRVCDWRTYAWKSFDGLEIEGMLALPQGYDGEAPLPLVVDVHGGPTGTWSWQFAVSRGWPQLLVSEGYAVFLPNPRGSSGRGQEFARANLGDMGGGDLKDILAGVDALVADGIADDARVAITGGSYGGFMASWAVTQTDRFAAAIPCAVVTDWTSFHYTTNIGQFDALFLQGEPNDPAGPYPRWSPVFHAHKCKTPTLIIHGEDDLCTPLPQATEFYNALVEAGCEVELVVYPREGHGWTEREHQIDAWNRVDAWLDKHVKNRAA